MEGTCEWFRSHATFSQWLGHNESILLLVTAHPGCGKSVLARFMFEEELPRRLEDATICYLFFKDLEGQNKLAACLAAILRQIFLDREELVTEELEKDMLKAGIGVRGNENMANPENLWVILWKICNQHSAGHTLLVFDALDECGPEDLKSFVNLLGISIKQQESAEQPLRVKMLMTTR